MAMLCVRYKLVNPTFTVFSGTFVLFLNLRSFSDLHFLPSLANFLLVSTRARARAKRPAPASCSCLHATLFAAATFWHWTYVTETRERRKERRWRDREKCEGQRKKDKKTGKLMQMYSPSRLQICKCCCDMQMIDYRALIRIKRHVPVN